MNVKLNRNQLEDKILGCWIGKNIGGTMGAPYEGMRKMLNVSGYATPKGQPLPNDDLDLQLVWLRAMEEVGPYSMSSNILAEYWLSEIAPHWNEYGIAKSNMSNGILPSLSGEICNEDWKHSNGAWIRSEVWATLAPGFPNIAIKYAIMDACIDHGSGEGTYGEIFTAALESIAFVETDIRKIIEQALTYIPEESYLAKCVKLVLTEYDKGTPYQDVRNMLVESTKELGWFQAPANIGFTVIGLLYGEGDMKKSLIHAINCGDDTDCTAATCGSILGILYGAERIPLELKEYIGDKIVTLSINGSYIDEIAKSCTALTERVMKMIPTVLNANGVYMEYTDLDSEYDKEAAFALLKGVSAGFLNRGRYSFEVNNGHHWKALVEYEKEPFIKANEEFKIKITFDHKFHQTFRADVDMDLPEGFTADYDKTVYMYYHNQTFITTATYEVVIKAGEKIAPRNHIVMSVRSGLNPLPLFIPITLLGK